MPISIYTWYLGKFGLCNTGFFIGHSCIFLHYYQLLKSKWTTSQSEDEIVKQLGDKIQSQLKTIEQYEAKIESKCEKITQHETVNNLHNKLIERHEKTIKNQQDVKK